MIYRSDDGRIAAITIDAGWLSWHFARHPGPRSVSTISFGIKNPFTGWEHACWFRVAGDKHMHRFFMTGHYHPDDLGR